MPGKTILLPVSNTVPTPVTVLIACSRVTVGEDASVAGYPTTKWQLMQPTANDQAVEFSVGVTYTFFADRGMYLPGDIAGYVQTVSGPTSFFQIHDGVVVGHG